MGAWMQGRYALRCESWPAFCERIEAQWASLLAQPPDGNIAIFTSAVPISLCMAADLGLPPQNALRLAGVIYNSAITVFRIREGASSLVSFNGTPHLADPGHWTLR